MISTASHPNSHIVTIFRKESFLDEAQKEKAADFIALAKKSIGSYWENSFSRSQGSGLSFAEQKLLMPRVVDCEPEDRNFRKVVSEYFACVKTNVPYNKGKQLEIGLEEDNSKPLSKDNMPLNLSDYITYRHALSHPQVAKSRSEGLGALLKEFYIYDPLEEEKTNAQQASIKDKAMELYLKVRKQPEKMDMLLTLLGVDPRTFKGTNIESQKGDRLRALFEANPVKFQSTFEDKFFDDLYVIQTMINAGILIRVGESVIDPETGDTVGHNMTEAVAWIKDKGHSDRLVILKARLQESNAPAKPATVKAQ